MLFKRKRVQDKKMKQLIPSNIWIKHLIYFITHVIAMLLGTVWLFFFTTMLVPLSLSLPSQYSMALFYFPMMTAMYIILAVVMVIYYRGFWKMFALGGYIFVCTWQLLLIIQNGFMWQVEQGVVGNYAFLVWSLASGISYVFYVLHQKRLAIQLHLLPGVYAMIHLPSYTHLEEYLSQIQQDFYSITKGAEGVSLVLSKSMTKLFTDIAVSQNFLIVEINQCKINGSPHRYLSDVLKPLRRAHVFFTLVSSFDKDYVIVEEKWFSMACEAWKYAKIRVNNNA
jgi:hypothetical protein